jgi:hypothetical protein
MGKHGGAGDGELKFGVNGHVLLVKEKRVFVAPAAP